MLILITILIMYSLISTKSVHCRPILIWSSLLSALNSITCIKRVGCRGWNRHFLDELSALYEISSLYKSVVCIEISHHIIDVENGVFCCYPEHFATITGEEVSYLHSLLETFNLKELTLKQCGFIDGGFNALCDLIQFNN
ncbi:hypothetical protein GEMRC1_008714 [Eukaryota sp. GEM-RC1]